MSDWTVKIEYKNSDMETVIEKEFDFLQYTEMLDLGLKGILVDVENAFYALQDNKQKDDWSDDAKSRFKAIRHKILDKSNAIRRLPQSLTYKGTSPLAVNFSDIIAAQLNAE